MSRRGRSRGRSKGCGAGNSEDGDLSADHTIATLQAEIAASVAAAEEREAAALTREKKREEEALTREQAQTTRLAQMMAKQLRRWSR